MKRLALLLLAASFLLAAVAGAESAPGGSNGLRAVGAGLNETSAYAGPKSASGQLAQTDPSLLHEQGSKLVPVMIKYDFDATSSYTGGIAGLAPTSPSVTGRPLADNDAAVGAYDRHVEALAGSISTAVDQAVPGVEIGQTYTTAYGGVAAQVPADKIPDLLKVPGVAAVQKDSLEPPLDDNTTFLGATSVWASLGGSSSAGSNVIVGDIDTGVWPENPMLSPTGIGAPAGGLRGCQFGNGSDVAHLGATFACNNKLIGAYAFLSTYLTLEGGSDGHEFCNDTSKVCSPRDSEGHGTHTTTTAAGDCVASAVLYGVDRGPVCGVAPGAHVIEYRVCLAQGCYNSDSVQAINQAITDGVNVINFSVGGGTDPYTDPVELAFLDAFHAGISVNASAGNDGPDAATVEHGAPWVTTVGASTGPRFFTSTLHLSTNSSTFDAPGVTITGGIGAPTPVILGQNIPGEDALCQTKLSAGSAATGKIVLCLRGTNARVDKGYNVFSGGAAGMILYNPVAMDVETDNHWLPTIHVDGPDTGLLNYLNAHSAQTVNATWAQGTPSATTPDVMATFSSRGPGGDFIKPDITAPGIQVLAGMTQQPDPNVTSDGPSGNDFQAIAGTSMSSPHAAGVSALVKAAHPTWTPAEIKSALMTSAAQGVVEEDGSTPATPFDDGAGSIRADAAVNPTVVFDETYSDYVASETDPLHRVDLNLPSIDAPLVTGAVTTHRVITNVSGHAVTLNASVAQPANGTITVTPSSIPIASPTGTATFTVTISGVGAPAGQEFGRITLTPQGGGSSNVTMPVAFDVGQGALTVGHTCTPTSIAAGGVDKSHCVVTATNTSETDAHADLTVTNQDAAKLDFKNITAPGTPISGDNGVHWAGTLVAATPPQITSFTNVTGNGPGGGYQPLSSFGITPIASLGDDTIVNYTVPTFYYGGEAYTHLGVGSNGYVVIGGGDTDDITAVPEAIPDTDRPNNIIAPFWTDLDPTHGGGVRIGILTDDVAHPATAHSWIVVDYNAVRDFSDTTTHTGEVWLQTATGGAGTGPSSERETISYAIANAGSGDSGEPNPSFRITSGAENRDGTSGATISPAPADNTEWELHATPPGLAGTVTIAYDASTGVSNTVFHVLASLTSDITPGATQAQQVLSTNPDARVTITPASASNRVGTTRTLTIGVAALNATIDPGTYTATASITNSGSNSSFVGPGTCTYTAAAPSCTVQLTGPGSGSSTVNATTTVSASGTPYTRTTQTPAQITWADATLSITPASDSAAVGATRTFTIGVTPGGAALDAGTFTATASLTSGPGSLVGGNTCTYTTSAPSCTVQVTSTSSGTTALHATASPSVAGIVIPRTADATETWTGGGGGGGGGGGASVGISLTPKTQTISSGGTASFTISVTNTGGGYLFAVGVSDGGAPSCNKTSGDIADFGALAPGVTDTYNCSVSGVTASFTNTATVTAQNGAGQQATARDTGAVTVNAPAAGNSGGSSITKTPVAPKPVKTTKLAIQTLPRTQTVVTHVTRVKSKKTGKWVTVYHYGTAHFTIKVMNLGTVGLSGVTIADQKAAACSHRVGKLAAGTAHTYTCTRPSVAKGFSTSATASGKGKGTTIHATSAVSLVKVVTKRGTSRAPLAKK